MTRLAAIGLTAKLYQSSSSTGWHVYLFFDDWSNSDEVQASLRAWLVANGYKIAGGTLEVFPSGNGLRLPLQQGFAWLELDGTIKIRREEIKENEALALFLTDLEENKGNWSEAKNLIETQLQAIASDQGERDQAHEERLNTDDFEPFYWRGIDWEKYQRGLRYWQDGLTGRNQRHDAVICIGHYLWYGDVANNVRSRPYPSKANERAELIGAWLREKHNGHSTAVNSGRWNEIEQDIERACSWTVEGAQKIKLESYPITDRMIDRLAVVPYLMPDDLKLANERREQVARKKIKDALEAMLAQGQHPTIRNMARASSCDRETVKRHRDIWALYAVRIETKLSTGGGDYSGGAGGVCSVPALPVLPSYDFSDSLCFEEKDFDLSYPPESVAFSLFDFGVDVLASAELPANALRADFSMELDSLRLQFSGATANNSTATQSEISSPPLPTSLATGSSSGAGLACMWLTAGGMDCSLNGFLPNSAEPPLGPFHLPQTKNFSMGSSERQSNRNCLEFGVRAGLKQQGEKLCNFQSRPRAP